MLKTFRFLFCIFILLLILSPLIGAKGEVSQAILALPGDVASIDWNPAILGVSPYTFQAILNPVNMNLWTNAWTPNDILLRINDYWDDTDKEELLNAIVGEAFSTGIDLCAGAYLGINHIAFRTGVKGSMNLGIDKEIFHLLLYGTGKDLEDLNLSLENTGASGTILLDTGFGMAYPLTTIAEELGWENLHLGGSLHYLTGLAHLNLNTRGTFAVDDDFNLKADGKMEAHYSIIGYRGGGGHGAAVGFGIWGEPQPNLGIGLSLTNLGIVRWSGVRKTAFEGEFSFKHPLNPSDEEEQEEEKGFTEIMDEPTGEPILWPTPIGLQGGVYYMVTPRIHLAGSLGYNQDPISHVNLSAATRLFFPSFIPVTIALDYASHKGTPSLSTSFGLRIGPWETFTFTISDIKLAAGLGKEMTIGLQTGFRF